MHLNDAMIDVKTGNPIVSGAIVLELGKRPPVDLPSHEHVLLDFDTGIRDLVSCRAVTRLKRLENGFYAVETAEPHLQIRPLGREAFGMITGTQAESRAAFRGPNWAGFANAGQTLCNIAGLEIVRRLGPEGMAFTITGGFAPVSVPQAMPLPGGVTGFEIRGLMPWETVKLLGLRAGLYHSDFAPAPQERVWERIESFEGLDSFTLADLRLPAFGRELIAAGHAQMGGSPLNRIVTIDWDSSGLSLTACDHVLRDAYGFCMAMDRRGTRFRSTPITWPCIEQLLQGRREAILGLTGDGIGSVTYETGALLEPGLREIVVLDAQRLDIKADLSCSGLRIEIAATMKSAGRIARSISEFVPYNSRWTQFSATALLPWSLLLVRGSRLAEQRDSFIDAPAAKAG